MTDSTPSVRLNIMLRREGDQVVAHCCAIEPDSTPHIFQIAVDIPALVRQLAPLALSHTAKQQDSVSGFGSWLKKAVKTVTHAKIVKGVLGVVKSVVKNPVFQAVMPMAAITAQTFAHATGSKDILPGPLGKIVNAGTSTALSLVPGGAISNVAKQVSPQAFAALGVASKTLSTIHVGAGISAAAKQASRTITRGKAAAQLVKSGKLTAAAAKPLVQKAVATRALASKMAPALAKRVVLGAKVKTALAATATKAKAGSPDARLQAAVIARTQKMHDQLAMAHQAAAGGLPGIVITADGRIQKSAKGRWTQKSSLPALSTLYRGPKDTPLRGAFAAVAGKKDRPLSPNERDVLAMSVILSRYGYPPGEAYRLRRKGITAPQLAVHLAKNLSLPRVGSAWGDTPPDPEGHHGPLYPARYKDPEAWPNVSGDLGCSLSALGELDQTAAEHEVSGASLHPLPPPPPSSRGNKDAVIRAWLAEKIKQGKLRARVSGGRPDSSLERALYEEARRRVKAQIALARARHHLSRTKTRNKVGSDMSDPHTDLPSELAEQSDGPSDVGASLIGCSPVAGFPAYLFTRAGLRSSVVRRRIAAHIKAMPPKMRRRVMLRLRNAAVAARVAGEPRGSWPVVGSHYQVGSHYGAISGHYVPVQGWKNTGVAGPLTP